MQTDATSIGELNRVVQQTRAVVMASTAMLTAIVIEGSDPAAIRGGCRRWVDEKTEEEMGRLEIYMGQTKILASLDDKVPPCSRLASWRRRKHTATMLQAGGRTLTAGSWWQARATVMNAFEKKVYVKDDDIITQVPAHPYFKPTHVGPHTRANSASRLRDMVAQRTKEGEQARERARERKRERKRARAREREREHAG